MFVVPCKYAHRRSQVFLAYELLVNPPSSGTLAFSLRLAPFLPASDSPALPMMTASVSVPHTYVRRVGFGLIQVHGQVTVTVTTAR